MFQTLIVKNNTSGSVFIEDLGTAVPGSGQADFTEKFDFTEVCVSGDLQSFVQDSTFTINDGTSDLNISEAQEYLDCKNEGAIGAQYLGDLIDVNLGILGDNFALVYNETNGKWEPGERNINDTSTPPPTGSASVWIPPEDRMPFFWDELIGEWLTIDRTVFSFGRAGRADGSFLQSSGVNKTGYYYIHRPAMMTHIYYRAHGGNSTKEVDLYVNGASVYNFNLVNGLYVSELDIPLTTHDEIQVRVSNNGSHTTDNVCQLEVAWRYQE